MAERIAILGAGAIGLYYGARLALTGQDVHFLLRSEVDAVRARGITLHTKDRTETLFPVSVSRSAREIGPVDLVFVTLKATANDHLAELLPPLLGPQTLVVTLQNGLGNEEVLARWVDRGRILGGLCFIACMRVAPGEVNCLHVGSITLGEYGRPPSDRTRRVAGLLENAGVPCRCVDSLAEARWRKLVWNVPFNGLSVAAGGITTDVICADPHLAGEVRALMEEVRAAAHALGFDVPAAFAQKQFDVTPPMGAYQPSSLVDFKAGRPLEVDAIWGEPLRRAQAAGVSTPRLALLHALLQRLTPA
ncbi:MAG: 2-dehydropantoate 2-reductase [Opitutaceae bacterium]